MANEWKLLGEDYYRYDESSGLVNAIAKPYRVAQNDDGFTKIETPYKVEFRHPYRLFLGGAKEAWVEHEPDFRMYMTREHAKAAAEEAYP